MNNKRKGHALTKRMESVKRTSTLELIKWNTDSNGAANPDETFPKHNTNIEIFIAAISEK